MQVGIFGGAALALLIVMILIAVWLGWGGPSKVKSDISDAIDGIGGGE